MTGRIYDHVLKKTLSDFDFSFNRSITRQQVYDLATSAIIRDSHDVLWLGAPGLGTNHLVQAIACEVITCGLSVLYRSVFDLVATSCTTKRSMVTIGS